MSCSILRVATAGSISFGVGRKNNERVEHALFDSPVWNSIPEITPLRAMAQSQLGTVGSGNHYVDLFEDEAGYVWIGVHFGSRGFGHKTATAFLKLGGVVDGMEVDPCVLHEASELGIKYVAAMMLAGEYAYAGREWVVEKVRSIVGGTVTDSVHNHHNYCWLEMHNGRSKWVVRKGATPAFPGQRGFVGGSMGDNAVILHGVESELSKASLYSTVHGAGRVMSRTEARGKWRKGVQRTEGRRHDDWQAWLREKGVTVLGGDVDEAPQAYRRLPDVLQAHAGTVQVEHTLRPFGVVMAGSKEFDPYKD